MQMNNRPRLRRRGFSLVLRRGSHSACPTRTMLFLATLLGTGLLAAGSLAAQDSTAAGLPDGLYAEMVTTKGTIVLRLESRRRAGHSTTGSPSTG
jgi:hypothetical protein